MNVEVKEHGPKTVE